VKKIVEELKSRIGFIEKTGGSTGFEEVGRKYRVLFLSDFACQPEAGV